MTRHTRFGFAAALLVATLMAACAPAASPPAPTAATGGAAPGATPAAAAPNPTAPAAAASGSVKKVSVCIPAIGQAFAYLPIAKEKGLYSQMGLDVSFEAVQGNACTQSLSSGAVQFGGSPSTLDGIVKGLPYRVVYVASGQLAHQIIVTSRITSFTDLKGGKIAISGPGGIADILTREVLKANGLDPDKDVTFITIGTPDARQTALISGAVDASAVAPDEAVLLLDHGLKSLPFKPLPIVGSLMTANASLIKSDPDLVSRFVKATEMGSLLYGKRKADVMPIVASFVQSNDLALQGKIYDVSLPAWNETGSLGPDQMQAIIDQTRKQQQVDKAFKPDEVFDFSFADKAYKELKDSNWEGLWK